MTSKFSKRVGLKSLEMEECANGLRNRLWRRVKNKILVIKNLESENSLFFTRLYMIEIISDKIKALGSYLAEIIDKIMDLDKHFMEAFSILYTLINRASGIRHASLEVKIKVSFDEAKFMLVVSAAFINYLATKYEKKKEADEN